MEKYFDGKNMLGIEMFTADNRVDWAADFFHNGILPFCSALNAHIVTDIDYLIEQAEDWKNKTGEFSDDGEPETEERFVSFEIIQEDFSGYVGALMAADHTPRTEEEWKTEILEDCENLPEVAIKAILKQLEKIDMVIDA